MKPIAQQQKGYNMNLLNPDTTRRYQLPCLDKIKPISPAENCVLCAENTDAIACLPDAVLSLLSPYGEATLWILLSA